MRRRAGARRRSFRNGERGKGVLVSRRYDRQGNSQYASLFVAPCSRIIPSNTAVLIVSSIGCSLLIVGLILIVAERIVL